MLVIQTQDYENYGAHDWDGEGDCPQHWKAKGGAEYKVLGVPSSVDLDSVVDMVRGEIECDDDSFRTVIRGYFLESDDYLSHDERLQLEFEGEIVYPDPTIEYADLVAA